MDEQMEAVHARVPAKVYRALASAADTERRTQSQLIRNILVDWYEQQEKSAAGTEKDIAPCQEH